MPVSDRAQLSGEVDLARDARNVRGLTDARVRLGLNLVF